MPLRSGDHPRWRGIEYQPCGLLLASHPVDRLIEKGYETHRRGRTEDEQPNRRAVCPTHMEIMKKYAMSKTDKITATKPRPSPPRKDAGLLSDGSHLSCSWALAL